MVRKGVSMTITILVTAVILLVSALLLIGISEVTVGDAVESISSFIRITGHSAECSALETRCNTMCETACRQGDEPDNLVAVPADESDDGNPVYCDELDCLEGWNCVCDEEGDFY